jgi:hypothetical protein
MGSDGSATFVAVAPDPVSMGLSRRGGSHRLARNLKGLSTDRTVMGRVRAQEKKMDASPHCQHKPTRRGMADWLDSHVAAWLGSWHRAPLDVQRNPGSQFAISSPASDAELDSRERPSDSGRQEPRPTDAEIRRREIARFYAG